MNLRTAFKLGAIPAALAGVLAYLVGYAITYAVVARDLEARLGPAEMLLQLVSGEPVGTWRVVGWIFHALHGVETRLVFGSGGVEAGLTVDPATAAPDVLFMIPVLTLLFAGFLSANFTGVDGPRAGIVVGTTVTVGYLLAVVVGLFVFSYEGSRPVEGTAVAIAGIGYPLVLGAIGGALESVSRTFEPRGTRQRE
ncbi:MAG: transporter [Halobacteriota archaeon]